jgi:hypothetical protein
MIAESGGFRRPQGANTRSLGLLRARLRSAAEAWPGQSRERLDNEGEGHDDQDQAAEKNKRPQLALPGPYLPSNERADHECQGGNTKPRDLEDLC